MDIQVRRAAFPEVVDLRELYRREANCQIIHDLALVRGNADPYLLFVDARIAGYGGVWNKHYEHQLMEFYTLPAVRRLALPMFRALLAGSGATRIEAQIDIPLLLLLLYDCAEHHERDHPLPGRRHPDSPRDAPIPTRQNTPMRLLCCLRTASAGAGRLSSTAPAGDTHHRRGGTAGGGRRYRPY